MFHELQWETDCIWNSIWTQRQQRVSHTFEVSWKPNVVRQNVWHGMIQGFQHSQGIVHIKHCIVIPKQDPLVAIYACCVVGNERRHARPEHRTDQHKQHVSRKLLPVYT
jgi:hypothetical protein